MTVSIYHYLNYREFLKDSYEARHAVDRRFSHRHIAELGGFDATLFNKILQGKRNLTQRLVTAFAGIFCHDDREKAFFADLVAYNQAKRHSEESLYLKRLMAAKECLIEPVAKDQFGYFGEWYNAVIRELLSIYPYVGDDYELGLMVRPPITASEARESVARLERLGMVRKKENGGYEQTAGFITSGTESYHTEVNSYVQDHLKLAIDAMDRFPNTERNLSTLVFSCDGEGYRDMVEMVRRFRRELLERANKCGKPNRVFQFGAQLFPLSDPYPPPVRRGPRRKIRGEKNREGDEGNV